MRWIDKVAESFGGIYFLIGFNAFTAGWMLMGRFVPHFFDPFPFIFYTLVVSWLAINMTGLLLWSDRRKAVHARREEEDKLHTLEAIQTLAETNVDAIPLIKQIATNQVVILSMLEEREKVK